VDGKIVPADADPRKQIVEGAKLARQKAESPLSIPLAQLGMSLGNVGVGAGKIIEQTFGTAKLATELGWFKAREAFIESPQQRMNTYIALLQDRSQKDTKRLADMSREAEWVRSPDAKSSKGDQAKARYVQALALRNEEKFAEAKAAFADTIKMTAGLDAGWAQDASKAQKELLDPNVYYLPKMRKLVAAGDAKAALSEADVALKAIPDDARLYAERGLIRIELIRGKGAKAAEEAQAAIKADAEAAAKNAKFAAESAYILGLLEEELTHWQNAETQFRQAIKLNEDSNAPPNEAGKYRVALARVLLRDQTEAADVPVPNPNENEKGEKKKDEKGGASANPVERTLVVHPWSFLVLTQIVSQQATEDPDDPAAMARYKEAEEQARKLIASDDKDLKGAGYLALGKALSKMGQRTQGLKAYAEGMRLLYPGMSTKDLKELIDQHPAFKQPESEAPNPLIADRHFGEGLHLYWEKKFSDAEAQFRQAVRYFDKDARYWYFMGLAQHQQKKKADAIYSFDKGAKLETLAAQSNPDAVRDVNVSLERIQGELRQLLNTYRYKAATGEVEEKK
jgi:TolA-binding protein